MTFDAFGNRRHCGGDRVRAWLCAARDLSCLPVPPDGGSVVPCEMIDCEDGTYLGVYTVALPPDHPIELHVVLNETPISGSPFAVEIES